MTRVTHLRVRSRVLVSIVWSGRGARAARAADRRNILSVLHGIPLIVQQPVGVQRGKSVLDILPAPPSPSMHQEVGQIDGQKKMVQALLPEAKQPGRSRRGECQMVKLVGMALLVALGVCGSLLFHRVFESPATLEPRQPHRPDATFGGMYRLRCSTTPSRLIRPW